MAMSVLLRSVPWSSSQFPLIHNPKSAASTSNTEWCSAFARTSPWTLTSCDVASQSATFVAAADGDGHVQQRIQCHVHVGVGDVEAVQADAEMTSPPQARTRVLDADVLLPSALSLAIIVYLLYLLRQARLTGQPTQTKKHRCVAVDVFRGLTICLMVFVNYGGGGFAQFRHSAWDGLTVADVVFPCFGWIMGFTMFLSTSNGRSITPWRRVLSRAAKLFAVGLFLNNGSSWTEWRIPGVLQALSAGYLLTTILTRSVSRLLQQHGDRLHLPTAVAHSVFGILPLVAVNLALTFGLHVPGCPRGYLGPGGDSDGGRFRNCTGAAHLYIDRSVFGDRHIYQTPTCQPVFHTGPYDPEGLLNWLMVAATTYCGFLAGARFKAVETSGKRVQLRASLVQGGVFFLAAAVVSGGFGLFSHAHWIPVNKNLWSLSYVLGSIAVANIGFAGLLFFSGANEADATAWTTLTHVGQNSIFIYTMHEILQAYAPFSPRSFGPLPAHGVTGIPQVVVLLQNVAGVLWWVFVAEWMHARGIIITV